MRHLFMIGAYFRVCGLGIVATPGVTASEAMTLDKGTSLELRRPDGSTIRTHVAGVEYPSSVKYIGPAPVNPRHGVLLPPEVGPNDVPAGTEVWIETEI
jgi:hypothetical protein